MPHYKYRAKKGPDDVVDGTLEARNKEDAIEKITQLGYLPVRIEEKADSSDSDFISGSSKAFTGRVGLRDITVFSGQLSSLIRSGVPILKALVIISDQSDNRYFRFVLNHIAENIKVGKTFSESLSNYPNIFSPLYIAIIKAGEDGGALHAALDRITHHLRKQEGVLSKVKTALIYPALMCLVGIGTVIFMLIFVIPRIKGIFTSSGQELPIPTKILIFSSDLIRGNWYWMLIIFIILFFIAKKISRTQKEFISALKLKIPLYGNFLRKAEIAQFSRTLELSLKSGIHILRAMELAIPILGNEVIKKELAASYAQVKQGGSLGRNLKKSKIFPTFMTNFIIIGEESGKLQEVFGEIADYFESDTDEAIKIFTAQLEPIMILIIGSVLGFVVIAMLLPIFQVNLMVQ